MASLFGFLKRIKEIFTATPAPQESLHDHRWEGVLTKENAEEIAELLKRYLEKKAIAIIDTTNPEVLVIDQLIEYEPIFLVRHKKDEVVRIVMFTNRGGILFDSRSYIHFIFYEGRKVVITFENEAVWIMQTSSFDL